MLLKIKKPPGYNKIDAHTIKLLPPKAVLFLTLIYNSVLRLQHFPLQWKCAEIIMIYKSNKPENLVSSNIPICLLLIFANIFKKVLIKRLKAYFQKYYIVPDHQFGFRDKHGTPEQCHRVIKVINVSFENKRYCSAVFLDIVQAFDKVWHKGLLYKLKKLLLSIFYLFFLSYLKNRSFYVMVNNDFWKFCEIVAEIPQRFVLVTVLYALFTHDLPTRDDITIATYAIRPGSFEFLWNSFRSRRMHTTTTGLFSSLAN